MKYWRYLLGKKLIPQTNTSKLASAVLVGFAAYYISKPEIQIADLEQKYPQSQTANLSTDANNQSQTKTNSSTEANLTSQKIKQSLFKHGICIIPHFQKRHKGGEDAGIAREDLLVVADGVGGWAQHGVDSGLFSKKLVKDIEAEYLKNPNLSLKSILIEAVKMNPHTGSSTAVLAKLDKNERNILKTCNLGDSGYAIFRVGNGQNESQQGSAALTLYFRSKEQQYSFNFPYQCGTGCDLPYAAQDNQHQLQNLDIIVMGSDGLFDNLYDHDLLPCIYQELGKDGVIRNHTAAAECMAQKAEKLSYDRRYLSPFTKGAIESGVPHSGGKPDDITVIVAQVHFKFEESDDKQQQGPIK